MTTTTERATEQLADVDLPPVRLVGLMAGYVALSSAVAIVTDLGLAWFFARLTERMERRAAAAAELLGEPIGVEDQADNAGPVGVAVVIDLTETDPKRVTDGL